MTYLGGSVSKLVIDRNTWHSRADQAWGTSRVWGSGSSFEQDSATWHARADQAWGASRVWNSGSSFEQDSATWHARADQAWGPSRVWGSGESWEAAYNRVLPPAAVVHLAAQVGYGTQGNDGWANNWQLSLTADRSGQWLVVGRASRSTYNSGVMLSVGSTAPGGSQGAFHGLDQGQANTSNGLAGDFWQGFLSAGQVVQAKAYMATGFSGGTLYMDMYFIPTQANAH